MALPKEQRNRDFIADWKGRHLSTEELAVKYSMTPGGVKALKQRLRAKDPSLYEKGPVSTDSKSATQQPGKVRPETKIRQRREPVIQQSSKLAEYKKVTYYLDPAMAKDIKRLALERDMDISELVREVLGQYLKNK
ncbi:MAG: hypothetical protein HWN68_14525 [Desulfobacterales bacterium]|nr:hypothetical protein [Desulfobacterales bacterium]